MQRQQPAQGEYRGPALVSPSGAEEAPGPIPTDQYLSSYELRSNQDPFYCPAKDAEHTEAHSHAASSTSNPSGLPYVANLLSPFKDQISWARRDHPDGDLFSSPSNPPSSSNSSSRGCAGGIKDSKSKQIFMPISLLLKF